MSEQHHIVPRSTYFTVFAILMLGTAITVWVAFLDLGPLNSIVALGIACTKAALVVLFFMHVKYSTRLTWMVVAGSVFWLFILLALTFNDYLTRHILTYG
jgi:cytochrome c oxidase subunit 4